MSQEHPINSISQVYHLKSGIDSTTERSLVVSLSTNTVILHSIHQLTIRLSGKNNPFVQLLPQRISPISRNVGEKKEAVNFIAVCNRERQGADGVNKATTVRILVTLSNVLHGHNGSFVLFFFFNQKLLCVMQRQMHLDSVPWKRTCEPMI